MSKFISSFDYGQIRNKANIVLSKQSSGINLRDVERRIIGENFVKDMKSYLYMAYLLRFVSRPLLKQISRLFFVLSVCVFKQ